MDIFDVVRASPAPGLSLSVSGPMARTVDSLGAANYVMRAASELRERAGVSAGAALH
ncbi:MAG: 4-(cytidine 5'-diphospho)-2-C-methyl-D-erythritol kinase, partial [Rhodospirillales bacterium]|nr:4-(cytidine 5'-diphospho)-2-C-methyl-D-erythritol kinase [Rhodospirillales bacterium]